MNFDVEDIDYDELASKHLQEYIETKNREELIDFIRILTTQDISNIFTKVDENTYIGFFYETIDGNSSILEFIIDKDINLSYSLKREIKKHGDLLKVFIDKGQISILDYADTDILSQKIGNITVLEYLFMKNRVKSNHLNFYILEDALEYCKKYNRLDLLPELYSKLFYLDLDGNDKVIDYLFKNNLVTPEFIKDKCNESIIIDYCIKYNRLDLLEHLNETVLLSKSKDGKSFLEIFIDNNTKINAKLYSFNSIRIILEKGRYDLLKNICTSTMLKKYDSQKYVYEIVLEHDGGYDFRELIESLYFENAEEVKRLIIALYSHGKIETLLNINKKYYNLEIVDGKTILDILLDNNFIPDITNISNLSIAEAFIRHGIYDKFKNSHNVDNEVYKMKVDDNSTLLDFLLQNGYDPMRYIDDIEIAKIYIKHGLYSCLDRCSSKVLTTKLENGKTVLEEFYDRGGSLKKIKTDTSKKMAKTIIKYKKYKDLAYLDIDTLLSLADLNNTYLDILLSEYKKDETIDIVIDTFGLDFDQKVKIYMKYAQYDAVVYLRRLEKEDLLKEKKGKRFIDVLLEYATEEDVNKIIPARLREDFEIAMILRLHGFEQKEIKLESITRDFIKEYFDEYYSDYENVELDSESEGLIKQYRNLMNDGNSDMELVETVIRAYKYLIKTNSKYKEELKHIIMLKIKANQEDKEYGIRRTDNGAYYQPGSNSIFLDSVLVDTLNHEMGHSLYHNMPETKIDDEMLSQMFMKMRTSSEFLEKVKAYSEEYLRRKDEVEKYVEETFMKEYDKSIIDEQRKRIEEYLVKTKEEKKKIYLDKGYSEEVLDVILNRTFTVDEYIEQDRRVKKRELVDAILRTQHSSFIAIGDFFDGIYEGRFRDNLLKDSEGNVIMHAYGHGVNYYSRGISNVIDEMIANYSEIVKSRNPKEGLRLLREYMGDELVDYLASYYENNILNSNKLKEVESGLTL